MNTLKQTMRTGNQISLCILFMIMITLSCASIETQSTPEPQKSEIRPIQNIQEETPAQVEEELEKGPGLYTDFTLASLFIQRNEYKKALEHLTKAIELDPESIFLNRKMALLLQNMNDPDTAMKYAKKAIALDQKDIGAHLILADIYSTIGDEESAISEYKHVLLLDPDHSKVRMVLASILIRKNQLVPALEHLDIILKKSPDIIIAHYYRGAIHVELKDYEAAEKDYLRALDLNEKMEPTLFGLGNLYQLQNRYSEAIEMYEKLLSYYPSNLSAKERLLGLYTMVGQEEKVESLIRSIKENSKPGDPRRLTLGRFLLQQGRLDESIAELELIVSAWPNDYKSRYVLALAYEENENPEKALTHLKMIKEESEYFVEAQIAIVNIYETLKEYDKAIQTLNYALEISDNKSTIYLLLGSLYEMKKEYSKAIETLQKGIELDPKNIELLFRLGVLFDRAGDKDKSIIQMRNILDIDPDYADALNYIGYTYAEQGIRLDEALDLIQKALDIQPDSGYIMDSLGWVYYQKGLYDKALESLEKAYSVMSDDPTIAEHLGDTYKEKGLFKKALEMYQTALSLEHNDKDLIRKKINEMKKLVE